MKFYLTSKGASRALWSNCSIVYFANRIDDFDCLLNIPETPKFSSSASCGNGHLDSNEQCDCGRKNCTNPCCDSKTCKLKEHAVCAMGVCCNLKV